MKLTIKNTVLFLLSVVFLLQGCGNHKENINPESAENKIENKEGHNESAEPVIISLTNDQIKAVGITYGNIEMKELTATLKANGNLKVPNNNKASVTSLYGGVIRTLNVQVGSFVQKGQVIATIANPQFIQLQEEFLTVSNKIIFAEQELERQKELNEGNAGMKRNLQSATAELNSLKVRKASLHQQIQLMGINPANVTSANLQSALAVTSPLSGTVSSIQAKIGSYADVTSPVAEIVDNGSLHLDLHVFEKDLPLLKIGQIIHFTLTNNPVDEYDAVVKSIGTAFENESKTIPVHCDVKGNKTGLIDGMNITAIVSLNNVTASAVPNSAIVSDGEKDYIFVVTDEIPKDHEHEATQENAEKSSKEIKTLNFKRIEVVKGVSEMGYTAITAVNEIPAGAKIVTQGAFFINAKATNTGGHEH